MEEIERQMAEILEKVLENVKMASRFPIQTLASASTC
jgi:hypothetical protein